MKKFLTWLNNVWDFIHKFWKGLLFILGVIAGLIGMVLVFILNKNIKKQVKKNDNDLKKVKEESKKDETESNNIDNNFKSSPFNRARNK